MRKKKIIWSILAVFCCASIAGAWNLKTTAATNTASAGKFSANGSRVVFRSGDIDYLNRELEQLYNEMDDSVLDSATANVTVSDSADMRRGMLSSHGIINYDNGKVTANAANLFALADGTDALGNAYATTICRALNEIGTYFDAEGNVNHTAQTAETIVLGCKQLAEGILQSQSVEHLSAAPVTSDNITAGAAAWVNGQCIIGNGADNERAYQRGIADGNAGNSNDVKIQYTYHVHTGNSGKNPIPDGDVYYSTSNPGGCYAAEGHTHNMTGQCSQEKHIESTPGTPCTKDIVSTTETAGGVVGVCEFGHHSPNTSGICGVMQDDEEIETWVYTCGTPNNTWKINCGKSAGKTVEEATVIIY